MHHAESLYAWAQERQSQLEREAERRKRVRQARNDRRLIGIRLPLAPRTPLGRTAAER
jgi:hypothetical protein